jgi:hypothetical protein
MPTMSADSYHRPHNTVAWKSVRPRPLLPFFLPPQSIPVHPPNLPSPPRQPSFNNNICNARFILSTHIIPSAFPRISPDLPPPQTPPASADKDQRKEFATKTCSSLLELEDRHAGKGFGPGSRKVLWNCVNRYVKDASGGLDSGRPGLTLFFVHANGFPKEVGKQYLFLIHIHVSYRFGSPLCSTCCHLHLRPRLMKFGAGSLSNMVMPGY